MNCMVGNVAVIYDKTQSRSQPSSTVAFLSRYGYLTPRKIQGGYSPLFSRSNLCHALPNGRALDDRRTSHAAVDSSFSLSFSIFYSCSRSNECLHVGDPL